MDTLSEEARVLSALGIFLLSMGGFILALWIFSKLNDDQRRKGGGA